MLKVKTWLLCQKWRNRIETWGRTRLFAIHFTQEVTNLLFFRFYPIRQLANLREGFCVMLCKKMKISREMSFSSLLLGWVAQILLVILFHVVGGRINDFTFSGCIQHFHFHQKILGGKLEHVQISCSFCSSSGVEWRLDCRELTCIDQKYGAHIHTFSR